MIVVDETQCVGCGQCARICHQRCIALANGNGKGVARIDHALCSTCTQCVAICPRRALSWDGAPALAYDKGRLPRADQLAELFKQRRTIRLFRAERIDRAVIEEIVGAGGYAPTNNYDLRAVVVDVPAMMKDFDAIIMRFTRRIYHLLYRPRMVFSLICAISPVIDPKHKVKMAHGLEKGTTFDTLPAAIVFVTGDRRIIQSETSAQYALYNMILAAQVRGIGSRINAAGSMVLDRSRSARRALGLRRHEHILGTLELGYPAVKFRNKVEGKEMRVHWNGRGLDG